MGKSMCCPGAKAPMGVRFSRRLMAGTFAALMPLSGEQGRRRPDEKALHRGFRSPSLHAAGRARNAILPWQNVLICISAVVSGISETHHKFRNRQSKSARGRSDC
jgi:hypothetical protein